MNQVTKILNQVTKYLNQSLGSGFLSLGSGILLVGSMDMNHRENFKRNFEKERGILENQDSSWIKVNKMNALWKSKTSSVIQNWLKGWYTKQWLRLE